MPAAIAGLSRRRLAGLALMLPAARAVAAETVLRGTVVFRERMALPPDAVTEVTLADVSRADAPARVIAETRIAGGQSPIPYELRFDPALVLPGRRHALRARITAGDRLLFASTTHHALPAGGTGDTAIPVQRVAGDAAPPGPAGRWLAEDIRGGGVLDRVQSVLEITAEGAVSGTGGCNRIAGSASVTGNRIEFGQLISTMMACTPAVMDQERKFLDALKEARRWRLDAPRRKLLLLDGRDRPVMVLAQA
ncbi:YbaY family lipoprotein [Roseomonas sp. NAR14]|uniref:YbaY family lipoprotein n=1 Tax=Roseomonas acroporae TaxID=2937791 RepID=A0A9X1YCP0_9PROT|nr:META domain-containing protein [Roseomonas acroporae]MCK8787315.1 YbaY family lipoprotein [Roseomonas acroporae]